jgi:hypothetical protein
MSDQGPAIADHAPIFEKHTITYSSAMVNESVMNSLTWPLRRLACKSGHGADTSDAVET